MYFYVYMLHAQETGTVVVYQEHFVQGEQIIPSSLPQPSLSLCVGIEQPQDKRVTSLTQWSSDTERQQNTDKRQDKY